MSHYQLSVISQVWILLAFHPVISYVYYLNSRSIAQSSHGLLSLAGFLYAVVVCEFTQFDPQYYWYWPIYLFFILSLLSTIYSIKAFKGKKYVHLIHVFTILSNILTSFVALMAVAHDWIWTPNKAFKTDSQRSAFSIQVEFWCLRRNGLGFVLALLTT